jgi:hypothetical protein
MDLEIAVGLSIRKQQHERLLHRSIWFDLIQSHQVIQQFFSRMALQDPTHFRNKMPKEAQFCVIWDSGASVTIMPHKLDFVGHYSKPSISMASGSRD